MGQESLVNDQAVAGEEFVRDFIDYVPVDVAFWIYPADLEEWFLYIASSEINDGNIDVAYGEVLRLLGNYKNQWLDAFQVKLLNCEDPLAVEVIEILNRFPSNKSSMNFNGPSIAGMAISGAYFYRSKSTPKL